MNLEDARQLQREISDKFLFSRSNKAVLVDSWDDNEPTADELIFDIFQDIFGVDIASNERIGYQVRLLTSQNSLPNLYISPIREYFGAAPDEIIAIVSSPFKFLFRKRPLEIGCSISHRLNNIRGTLGCFVKGVDDGETYVLSNHHVLYNSSDLHDNFIIQPCGIDGGQSTDTIGLYCRSLPYDQSDINEYDAAIGGPVVLQTDLNIPGLNTSIKGDYKGNIEWRRVYKFGASTGLTYGMVTTAYTNTPVLLDNTLYDFQEQISIQGFDKNFKETLSFANDGDSGSLVIDLETNMAIGLLFAGNEHGIGLANKISPVLTNLGVKF